ncbi:flagellar filament capping protein FliD [Helicobacter sp. MIT 00-7814]|uniref:flagellar filament capping protein FliD n=1 Tax=unclassified Helicobacter TaxID=2593540 RepID=UPI000E1F5752|nr:MULTISPECIES: flagellar filament capping protein FliD [unclassified Helicobacter]RDU55882.1 flagellar filament capping protein FliD [Helicobacter sp. MIT 00-7814]RDU56840.1 flagellar filament capping protein FliD [Helicobacter sp. MIT 99-10781]
MALGKLSSLGIGSNVLNYDTIEKLRKADEASQIKPLEKKMEKNLEKQTELVELTSAVREIKSYTSKLADYSTYLGRSSNVVGDAVKATITAGVPVQDIKLDIESIAKSDINEVGTKFAERDSVFTQKDATLNFFTKGKFYEIEIKAGMALDEVAQLITDKTNSEVIGTIMKTGGSNPYQLMINSKETGESNRIYFGALINGDTIKNGALDIKDDDFSITLATTKGASKTLNISLKTSADSKTNDNASALKEAIVKAIEADSDFEGLLENGDLNIGLGAKGDSLIINDRRGNEVQVGGAKARELGFKSTTSKDNLENKDLVTTNPIKAGLLKGTITIGSVPLDLSTITKKNNTSYDNAKAIAAAIDNIAGLHSNATQDGKVIINSDTGEVSIIPANDSASKEALESWGVSSGSTMDYTKTQNDLFKIKNIQAAQDAEFSYNGIKMRRPSNSIDDVASGITLELLSTTEPGKPAIINVTRDDEAIIESLTKFVESYNALSMKVDELTRFDEDSKIAGVFNGDSDVRMIRPTLNKIFSYTMGGGIERQSLVKYGITINEKGVMSLDTSTLRNALNSDPEGAKEFFQGKMTTREFREIEVDGVFKMLDKELAKLVDGSNSRLKLLEESLTREDKKLKEDKNKANAMLDTRYDLMAQRFAAYDGQISRTNNSFNSVQMMIDQSVANNKK